MRRYDVSVKGHTRVIGLVAVGFSFLVSLPLVDRGVLLVALVSCLIELPVPDIRVAAHLGNVARMININDYSMIYPMVVVAESMVYSNESC